jgi:hypothetical protein
VLREATNVLHWSIEPEKMNFSTTADTIYASFELVLRLEDGRGVTVFERTEEIPLKLSPEQYQAHARQRFAFQDMLAVAPGEYRALFLLKNKTATLSSFETRITVPPAESAGQPALACRSSSGRDAVPKRRQSKAFAAGQQYLVGAAMISPPRRPPGVFVRPGTSPGRWPGRQFVSISSRSTRRAADPSR